MGLTRRGTMNWQITVNQKDIMIGCYGKCDKKKVLPTSIQMDIAQTGDNTK